MNKIQIQFYKDKNSTLILGSFEDKLCLLDFKYRDLRNAIDARLKSKLKADFVEANNPILDKTKEQLDQYFSLQRVQFEIPLLMVGTEFQQQVWRQLLNIPYGKTTSYLALAKAIKRPKAVRAVANANRANALSIIIPCHRVIGHDGKLVGYGGGLTVKKQLLELESIADRGLS